MLNHIIHVSVLSISILRRIWIADYPRSTQIHFRKERGYENENSKIRVICVRRAFQD